MNGSAAPAVETMSFEEALAELKAIVERLESGQGRLEDAITAYERGAHLKAHCETKLREASLKIEAITQGSRGPATEPFEAS